MSKAHKLSLMWWLIGFFAGLIVAWLGGDGFLVFMLCLIESELVVIRSKFRNSL